MLKLKTCTVCKEPKLSIEFNKNKRKKDGLQTHCKICSKIRFNIYYNNNKLKHKTTITKRKKENIKLVQQHVYDYLKRLGCADCKENDPCCLDFDHVRGNKRDCLSRMVSNGLSLNTIILEIDKCTVRCSNCHRKKTAKDFNWYRNINTGLSPSGLAPDF